MQVESTVLSCAPLGTARVTACLPHAHTTNAEVNEAAKAVLVGEGVEGHETPSAMHVNHDQSQGYEEDAMYREGLSPGGKKCNDIPDERTLPFQHDGYDHIPNFNYGLPAFTPNAAPLFLWGGLDGKTFHKKKAAAYDD